MFSFFRSRRQARKARRRARSPVTSRARPAVEALEDRTVPSGGMADTLYVSDVADNTVKAFDAASGAYQGAFVTSGSGGLNGPNGLIFGRHHDLVVVNQNVNTTLNGEVFRYDGETGAFLNKIVATTDPHAPFDPQGIVRGPRHTLFVADLGDLGNTQGTGNIGRLIRFDDTSGAWQGDLTATGFTGEFNPRAVVTGPDDALYVSVRNVAPTGGHILKFSPRNGRFLGDFVDSDATNDMNRPSGIVFGPDGNLYVSSFRSNAGDTDKILEFNGQTGAYLGKIDLDQVGQPRAFAAALLFGPDGKLFVPITNNGPDTGAVRRYDVSTGTFDVFVPPSAAGGPLGSPTFLTFGNTDPKTLTYEGDDQQSDDGHGAQGDAFSHHAMPSAAETQAYLGPFLIVPSQSKQPATSPVSTRPESMIGSLPGSTPTALSPIRPADSVTARPHDVDSSVDWLFADVGSEAMRSPFGDV